MNPVAITTADASQMTTPTAKTQGVAPNDKVMSPARTTISPPNPTRSDQTAILQCPLPCKSRGVSTAVIIPPLHDPSYQSSRTGMEGHDRPVLTSARRTRPRRGLTSCPSRLTNFRRHQIAIAAADAVLRCTRALSSTLDRRGTEWFSEATTVQFTSTLMLHRRSEVA